MSDEDLFDPNGPEYKGSSGDTKYKDLKEPGEYLLGVRACVKHGRTPARENGGNKLYSRFAFVVIDGPHKDESFTDRIFRSPSSYKRLAFVCKAMRITEKFAPGKNSDVERVMVGRTLKGEVEVNENGYAELKWPRDEYEPDELTLMAAWEVQFKRAKKKSLAEQTLDDSDFSDPGFPDDSGFPVDDFGDSDIPF